MKCNDRESKRLNLIIVSDGTGTTAESVATSVLLQFGGVEVIKQRFPFARSMVEVNRIMDRAEECSNAVLVHSLVSSDLRNLIKNRSEKTGIIEIDIMGAMMDRIGQILKKSPKRVPGLMRPYDEDYYAVAGSIEYTLRHDDGKNLDTLQEADLVILGVSRTGKTPTSIYLSSQKVKVANIPVILDMKLSSKVYKVKIPKVGFTIRPEKLFELRKTRAKNIPRMLNNYESLDHILEENEYCREVFERIPDLRKIDVTDRSIEETADWIKRNVL